MQLVGLQRIFGELRTHGVALFAISYDKVSELRRFADRWGIEFPLLSDEGSAFIRRTGMLDVDLVDHHAEWGLVPRDEQLGVAYPGVFVLDKDGIVVESRFERNYRERRTAETLLDQALGIAVPPRVPEVVAPDGPVRITGVLDSPTYSWFANLRLRLEFQIESGWHVYADGAAHDQQPLVISVTVPPGVVVEMISRTPPQVPWEGALAHGGTVVAEYDVIFGTDPGGGDKTVRVEFAYQACSETACLPPARRVLEIPVAEVIDPRD